MRGFFLKWASANLPARCVACAAAAAAISQVRKDHEGHFEEITGRMSGDSAGQTVRKKKVGKVTVIAGTGRGVSGSGTEETFDPPSIEVVSFTHLDDRCPG